MQAQKAIITFTYYTMANKALWCEKSSQRDFLKWTETKANVNKVCAVLLTLVNTRLSIHFMKVRLFINNYCILRKSKQGVVVVVTQQLGQ